MSLRVATYNIHKGFSQFNRRMVLHELRERLRETKADIVFLQEVQGQHALHANRFTNWPAEPQYEFLADSMWAEHAYGRNAVYDHGHHGNAILSRYPIISVENQDISTNRFESRGLLHCEIHVPRLDIKVHCLCVHFALIEEGRRRQLQALIDRIRENVPADAPVIVAGDFNDWRNRVGLRLHEAVGLQEVFRVHHGRSARSYPSRLPLFCLDRIYVRGFRIAHAEVHHGQVWSRISDHAMLSAQLAFMSERRDQQ
ncbi:MAG TPA: endonuclease/exonuclease/phosphatase family protein [Burkholderiales bacterium]|nr:endonuclease/exonuclease/phosphatase family protein [Burkholderiales bacterium]